MKGVRLRQHPPTNDQRPTAAPTPETTNDQRSTTNDQESGQLREQPEINQGRNFHLGAQSSSASVDAGPTGFVYVAVSRPLVSNVCWVMFQSCCWPWQLRVPEHTRPTQSLSRTVAVEVRTKPAVADSQLKRAQTGLHFPRLPICPYVLGPSSFNLHHIRSLADEPQCEPVGVSRDSTMERKIGIHTCKGLETGNDKLNLMSVFSQVAIQVVHHQFSNATSPRHSFHFFFDNPSYLSTRSRCSYSLVETRNLLHTLNTRSRWQREERNQREPHSTKVAGKPWPRISNMRTHSRYRPRNGPSRRGINLTAKGGQPRGIRFTLDFAT